MLESNANKSTSLDSDTPQSRPETQFIMGSPQRTPLKSARKSAVTSTPTKSAKVQKAPRTPGKVAMSEAKAQAVSERVRNWNFDHNVVAPEERSKNGRVKGRVLVNWNKPRMNEKFFLNMLYECEVMDIHLPWDQAAHRLFPGLTGGALQQRVVRLRKELVAQGHLVPPKSGRGSSVDLAIRGYVREFPGDPNDLESVRPVRFDEPWEDPHFNDPTGSLLVHNKSARLSCPRKSPAKTTAQKTPAKDDYSADNSDEDSHTDFDAHAVRRRSPSARLATYNRKCLKEASSSDDDNEDVEDAREHARKVVNVGSDAFDGRGDEVMNSANHDLGVIGEECEDKIMGDAEFVEDNGNEADDERGTFDTPYGSQLGQVNAHGNDVFFDGSPTQRFKATNSGAYPPSGSQLWGLPHPDRSTQSLSARTDGARTANGPSIVGLDVMISGANRNLSASSAVANSLIFNTAFHEAVSHHLQETAPDLESADNFNDNDAYEQWAKDWIKDE
ncbi:hypothetical protein BJ170DRAFT_696548 [Xylariales sp. AK1849]|nr:hypothetical protein BJ170DRAFT_696548 [Xylariales sp. AK1849]